MKKNVVNSVLGLCLAGLAAVFTVSAGGDALEIRKSDISEQEKKETGFKGMAKMAGALISMTAAIAVRRKDPEDEPKDGGPNLG